MVCFVALSLTKRRKGKDTQNDTKRKEKNGTTAHQEQKDNTEKRKKGKKTRSVEKNGSGGGA